MKICAIAAAAAFAVAAPAAASSVATYDLSGADLPFYGILPSEFELPAVDDGTPKATFRAGSFSSWSLDAGDPNKLGAVTYVADPRIGRYSLGAGVSTSWFDGHTVDGTGSADFIEIEFAAETSITELMFGYFDEFDDFRWMYDSNEDGVIGEGDFISDKFSVAGNNPFGGIGVSSKLFAVGAFEGETCVTEKKTYTVTKTEWVFSHYKYYYVWDWKTHSKVKKKKPVFKPVTREIEKTVDKERCGDDSWKLHMVTAETSVIPLPAGIWFMLAGVGGLAAMRRRS